MARREDMLRFLLLLPLLLNVKPPRIPADPDYFIILGAPDSFSKDIPPSPPESHRKIGFGIVLFTLRTPWSQLRQQVEQALDTAQRTNYPLLIHMDDWNFPPANEDPDWAEWIGFPQPGEKHGPLVKQRWFDWGQWVVSGPPPNYESPEFRAYMRQQIEKGVVKPVAERLKRWRREGRSYLFAGLVMGWESGYYSMPTMPIPSPKSGSVVFDQSDVVTTGYAALSDIGYNAKRLYTEAKKKGITEQDLFRQLMTKVVHDYTEYLCRLCVQGGIPRNRVYTHYTPSATIMSPEQIASDGRLLPVSAAVNRYSRPGYTMTHGWMDREKTLAGIWKAGRKRWGAVEMEIVPGCDTEQECLNHFDWLTNHGAKVLCLYGWTQEKGTQFAVNGSGAMGAIRKWLEGDTGKSHR